MIIPNVEQNLGRRTWLLLLSKKTTTAAVLMLLAVILGSAKDFIGQGLSGYFTFLSNGNISSDHIVSSVVSLLAVITLAIGVLWFIIGYIIARIEHRNYTFTMEEFDLKLRRGIFDIKEVSIPYRQIQNVDITKPLIYQFFGVSRLVLATAGHSNSSSKDGTDTIFDPIDTDLAEEVRVMLQKRIGVQVVEGGAKNATDMAKDSIIATESK
ncbi:MAG: PH domain-containing protein [Candidatus Taylorbacteria bacterium]